MISKTAAPPLVLFAAAVAFLIPVAFFPGLEGPAWSGRSAILLLVVAVGLPVLLSQARAPHAIAARCAIAFLLVGAASAALSHNRTTAVFGLYNQGTGLLFMAGLAAAWAIGLGIGPGGRPLLESALIAGVLVNTAVAIVAPLVNLPSSLAADWFGDSGRSQALAGNPVHLAALAVLGLALVAPRFASSPFRWAIPAAAMAAAVQLSGTRLALLVMLGIVAWAGRRHGICVAAGLALFVGLGLVAGAAIAPASQASATKRATAAGSWRTRPATWESARHSIVGHPLLGVGPGQFRTATSPYRPVSVALAEGPEGLFTDAHNLFIEYLTTTGIGGLGALGLWLVAALRPARGWLLVGALGVLVIHLFEPQSVVVTPLAFLALGAAAAREDTKWRPPTGASGWVIPAVSTAAALAVAGVFLVGEFDLAQAQLDLRAAPAQQAARILPSWPRPASLLARVLLFEGITGHRGGPEFQASRSWRLAAVHRDDADPSLWNDLAEYDEGRGRPADARSEYLAALRLNPTSARAMDGLARLAQAACDPTQAAQWHRRSLQVAPPPPGRPVAPPAPGQPVGQPPAPACPGQGLP